MGETKPFFIIASLPQFFGDILKRNAEGETNFKLGDCYILVVSRDITTSIGMKSRDYTNVNEWQSRYENVEFITSLIPAAVDMEYLCTTGMDTFLDNYVKMLQARVQMSDIISICDCVVNRSIPIFIIVSSSDLTQQYPLILRDYIQDEFGLRGSMMEDIESNGIETIYDIGNVEEIKKSIAEHIDVYRKQYDTDYFFNTLTDDMQKAYREMLGQHTEAELRELAKERHLFISRRYSKEDIIEKIVDDITAEGR
ncbi:hypothetical protein [Bacteroides acidifaciens]|uniref:hypothetical protein n=1 Tax=Bacteroides acidifaciens TaxID=85831 RepID=UPI0026EF9F76|nr:hypothetical protein [Bacteroides acidifaciens]